MREVTPARYNRWLGYANLVSIPLQLTAIVFAGNHWWNWAALALCLYACVVCYRRARKNERACVWASDD